MFEHAETAVRAGVQWLQLGVELLGALVIAAGIAVALPGIVRHLLGRERGRFGTVLQDLRLLLEALQVEPPYVLVGHSLGGLHAQLFARRHPQEVAGLVLVESLHADDREQVKGHAKRLSGVLARQLHVSPEELRSNIEEETAQVDASAAELDTAGPFPAAPLAAITGGKPPPAWLVPQPVLRRKRAHQKALARLSPRGVHVVADRSGHFPQLTQPRLVLDAIASVVAQRAAAR